MSVGTLWALVESGRQRGFRQKTPFETRDLGRVSPEVSVSETRGWEGVERSSLSHEKEGFPVGGGLRSRVTQPLGDRTVGEEVEVRDGGQKRDISTSL